MKVVKLASLIALSGLLSSCFLASEMIQRSVDAGKPNIKPTTITTKGATAGMGAGIITNVVLSALAKDAEGKRIRNLVFYCETENPLDKGEYQDCIEWGQKHWEMAKEFNRLLHNGKCSNKYLGLVKGFVKCWDEALDYARFINNDVEKGVYQAEFDLYYALCMPLGIDDMKPEELNEKHLKCKKEADEKANKFIEKSKDKINEFLAKSK